MRKCPRRSPREQVKAGKLVQVLEPFAPMTPGVFLYYPSRHQMMPKLRAFIDHVKSRRRAARKIETKTQKSGFAAWASGTRP